MVNNRKIYKVLIYYSTMGHKEFATGLIGFAIGAFVFGNLAKWALSPKQAYVQKADLNQDGVPDLIIEQRQGHKVPMYGIRKEGNKEGNIMYVSALEMLKKNPKSIINYEKIEEELNKKKKSNK